MADPKPSGSEQGSLALIGQKVSLGMIANTVEQFSGKNVKHYFEKIEQRAKVDEWDEQTTLNLIKYRLTGDAYNYFKTDPSLDNDSYTNFKSKFIKRFSPIVMPGQALNNLNRTYQRHDETVNQFVTRLKLIGVAILEEDLRTAAEGEVAGIKKKVEQLVLNQFKSGLSKHLLKNVGTVLMREQNLTIDRAEELATQEELNEFMLRPRHPNLLHINRQRGENNNNNCFRCGQQGHFARFCSNSNPQNYFQNRREQNFNRYQPQPLWRSQGNGENNNNYDRGSENRNNRDRASESAFQNRNLQSDRQTNFNLGAVPRRNNSYKENTQKDNQGSLNGNRVPPTVPREGAWN